MKEGIIDKLNKIDVLENVHYLPIVPFSKTKGTLQKQKIVFNVLSKPKEQISLNKLLH